MMKNIFAFFVQVCFVLLSSAQNHDWCNFPFEDAAIVASRATEEKFARFLLDIFPQSPAKQNAAVKELYIAAKQGGAEQRFITLAEKYLYAPNSPYRQEELYLSFLRLFAQDSFGATDNAKRYKHQYVMIQKNRVGMLATDFSFILSNGTKRHLYEIQSNYTILFFNDPACNDCRQVKQLLSITPECTPSVGVTVLALYIDSDTILWRNTAYPVEWMNAYVGEIDDLYDIKALPTLYLLDATKQVVQKDVSPDQLIAYLRQSAYVAQ